MFALRSVARPLARRAATAQGKIHYHRIDFTVEIWLVGVAVGQILRPTQTRTDGGVVGADGRVYLSGKD